MASEAEAAIEQMISPLRGVGGYYNSGRRQLSYEELGDTVWTTREGERVKVRDMKLSQRRHALALLLRRNEPALVAGSRIGRALARWIDSPDGEPK